MLSEDKNEQLQKMLDLIKQPNLPQYFFQTPEHGFESTGGKKSGKEKSQVQINREKTERT